MNGLLNVISLLGLVPSELLKHDFNRRVLVSIIKVIIKLPLRVHNEFSCFPGWVFADFNPGLCLFYVALCFLTGVSVY